MSKSFNHLAKSAFAASTLVLFSASTGLAACYIAKGNGEAGSMERASRLAEQDAARKAGGALRNASYSEPVCFAVDHIDRPPSYGCEVELSFCDAPTTVAPPKHVKNKKRHYGSWSKRHSWKSKIKFGSHYRRHTSSCLNFTASAKHRTETKSIRLAEKSLDKSLRKNTGYGFDSEAIKVADPQCWQTTPGIVNCSIQAKFCQ